MIGGLSFTLYEVLLGTQSSIRQLLSGLDHRLGLLTPVGEQHPKVLGMA